MEIFQGIIGLVIGILLLVWAGLWIFFPIFVYVRMGKMIAETERTNKLLASLHVDTRASALREDEAAKARAAANQWRERSDTLLVSIEKNTRAKKQEREFESA